MPQHESYPSEKNSARQSKFETTCETRKGKPYRPSTPIHGKPGIAATPGSLRSAFEHDACGVGFVVNMKGRKSHDIVEQALTILVNLDHRGACGCEANTGDGAGILMQMPHKFLKKVCGGAGHHAAGAGAIRRRHGLHLAGCRRAREKARQIFEKIVAEEGQTVLGWRDVPTDNSSLGHTAQASEPFMRQVFIGRGANCADEQAFERKLYVIRKRAENADPRRRRWTTFGTSPSLSCRTLIYKGMLMPAQVAEYFPDLRDPDMETALALVHSRFSTNTFPSWERAHPYRYIAHNGEINTLRGNINWMHARQALFECDLFGDDLKKILPDHQHRRQRLGDVRQLPSNCWSWPAARCRTR